MVFFAIWWAWMNFTWFASAYDCDDAAYRVVTLLQMAGVLVLAAGVPAAFDDKDFRVITVGYLVMRVGDDHPVAARGMRADPQRRNTNLGYAVGIGVVQLGWLARLALRDDAPELATVVFFVLLVIAEIAVPWLTERQGMTPWHPHHIAERYGLFTIIVLGESVTAASVAMSNTFDARRRHRRPGDARGRWPRFAVRHVVAVLLARHRRGAARAAGAELRLGLLALLRRGRSCGGRGVARGCGRGERGARDRVGSDRTRRRGAGERTLALRWWWPSPPAFRADHVDSPRAADRRPRARAVESAVGASGLVLAALLLGNASLPLAVLVQGLIVGALVAYAVYRTRGSEPAAALIPEESR